MIRKVVQLVLAFSFLVLVSCNKDEGTGGEGSVKGTVMKINFDREFGTHLDTSLAVDQDVYIVYGKDGSLGDRTRTAANGSFEFKYLRDGDYKIYTLSDDTLGMAGKKITIDKTVSVKNGNSATTDAFVVYNGCKYDDGSAKIYGRVYMYNWNKSGTSLSGQYWAQDYDVFIVHGDKPGYDDKVSTAYDGTFEFPKLIKGSYKVFLYTAHRDSNGNLDGSPEDAVIIKNVTITIDYQEVDLGTINAEKL